mgnify:CR=1 FL=1
MLLRSLHLIDATHLAPTGALPTILAAADAYRARVPVGDTDLLIAATGPNDLDRYETIAAFGPGTCVWHPEGPAVALATAADPPWLTRSGFEHVYLTGTGPVLNLLHSVLASSCIAVTTLTTLKITTATGPASLTTAA